MSGTEPKGYWVARVDVANEDAYQRYRALNAIALEKYGARFLVRGPAGKIAKGTPRKHNVVLEFKDYATALACYESPEYQAALVVLHQVGEVDLVIVPGHTG